MPPAEHGRHLYASAVPLLHAAQKATQYLPRPFYAAVRTKGNNFRMPEAQPIGGGVLTPTRRGHIEQ